MALNIKNNDVETLLDRVVTVTGESKTEAVRKALSERLQRLSIETPATDKKSRVLSFLENELWPQIPEELLGKAITKEEEEAILGFGEHGV